MKFYWVMLLIFSISFLNAESTNGFYIEQKVLISDSPKESKPEIIRIWFTDNKIRIQQKSQEIIIRSDLKKVYIIFPKSKEYMELKVNQLDQFLMLSNVLTKVPIDEISFTKSKRLEKVGQWDCYRIESESKKLNLKLWLTEELKFDRSILLDIYEKIPGLSSISTYIGALNNLPGFPVKSEMVLNIMGNEIRVKNELIKISAKEIENRHFNLPENLKKLKNPFEIE